LRLFAFTITTALIFSCETEQKFDKTSWQQRGDLGVYPNRAKMLNDLMSHHQLKGLRYKQLIHLLGDPERYSDEEPNTVTYNIVTDYGRDIDPVYIKNLEVKFNSDIVVTEVNVNKVKH
jgi:hypothetical protein